MADNLQENFDVVTGKKKNELTKEYEDSIKRTGDY